MDISIAGSPVTPRIESPTNHPRPCVIAHRGASAIAPENTLLAFRLAAESGAGMIETDAHLSRDDQVVLIHDADLARTTSCTGSVADLRGTELASCDTGYWFVADDRPQHPFRNLGLGVPTLGDLFSTIDAVNRDMKVNIEIKNAADALDYDPTQRIADRLIDEIRALGVVARVLVSSFNSESIDRIKALDPTVRTAYLCAPWADLHARTAYAVARGHDALHPHHGLLGSLPGARRTVEMVHRAGLEMNVWTVNDPERMRELAAAGVDGIMTDDPERLWKVLNAE